MIWESSYWKDPLIESANRIQVICSETNSSDVGMGELEHLIMTGFFSIRKLIEARTKLTESTVSRKWPISRYNSIEGNRIDLMNWHRIDKFYDLERPNKILKDIGYISNQFIHSFVFSFEVDELERIVGCFLVSDKDKGKFCNSLSVACIVEIFETVGNDYPNSLHMIRDKCGDWEIQ